MSRVRFCLLTIQSVSRESQRPCYAAILSGLHLAAEDGSFLAGSVSVQLFCQKKMARCSSQSSLLGPTQLATLFKMLALVSFTSKRLFDLKLHLCSNPLCLFFVQQEKKAKAGMEFQNGNLRTKPLHYTGAHLLHFPFILRTPPFKCAES